MVRPLTKPQVSLLTRLMREQRVPVAGPSYRVATTLDAQGLCALLTYRTRLWGDHGSMATMLDMEEVQAALATHFPESIAVPA